MKREYTLWLVVMAASLHILEEFTLNFVGWARVALGLTVSWEQFHLVNASLIVFGIAAAMIGWRVPEVSLMSPAMIAVNAVLFHIPLSLIQWRLSPGTVTSVVFFIPVSAWAYYGAYRDGVLTRRALLVSLGGGIFISVYLAALLLTLAAVGSNPYQ
jgi:hypothetical protein